ncbi:MAG TPA: PfkB family carbohydrate kinase [Acidimicrobiales bacterium]|nr:PfkB family carbohydrate kinase [Acidimicrobiales bacterium]
MSVPRVAVIGDVMLDVIVQPSGVISPASDTPSHVQLARGGAGANLAVALVASGCEAVFLGAAGDDVARQIFLDGLKSSGVTAYLEHVSAGTGTVVALVDDTGQRSMLTDRGANSMLSEAFVLDQLAAPFDHVHVSGYLVLDAATRGVASAALRDARERGRSTSVDVCSVAPLRAMSRAAFIEAAAFAEQFFSNEDEALSLMASEDVEVAVDHLAEMFREVVVTRGALGALGDVEGRRYHAEALATMVIDTTGAGDAAAGTYLGARLHGDDPQLALERAMAASARVVSGFGAG